MSLFFGMRMNVVLGDRFDMTSLYCALLIAKEVVSA